MGGAIVKTRWLVTRDSGSNSRLTRVDWLLGSLFPSG